MAADKHFTYKDAGVDVAAGNEAVRLFKERLRSIHHPLVLEGIGGFGGLMRVPPIKDAVLVAGTDGAGTKVMLAREMGVFGTIGIDAVAMSVNDVSACGAVPFFFLDYLVVGKLEPHKVADIVAGVDEGCLRAQCVLLGGETAEHPGHFADDDGFDLAGFAVGIASRSELWGPAAGRARRRPASASPRTVCTPTASRSCAPCSPPATSPSISPSRRRGRGAPAAARERHGAGRRAPAGATVGEVLLTPTDHLQPRAARPRPRLPGARRRAHHRRRVSRQRRPHPARRRGGRPRPVRLAAAGRLLLAARPGRDGRRDAQDLQLRPRHGPGVAGRQRAQGAQHVARAGLRRAWSARSSPSRPAPGRCATRESSPCEIVRPDRLRGAQPRPHLPPAGRLAAVARAAAARRRAGRSAPTCAPSVEDALAGLEPTRSGGGQAANTAYALARLGFGAAMLGRVGADDAGRLLAAELAPCDDRYLARDGESGRVYVLLNEAGERRNLVWPAANDEFSPADLPRRLPQTRFAYFSSFVGERPLQTQLALLERLPADVEIAFDPGEIYARLGVKCFIPFLKRASFVFRHRERARDCSAACRPTRP